MRYRYAVFFLMLSGCAGKLMFSDDFQYREISTPQYTIVTYQRILDATQPIHIYIEGDGNAFNNRGQPTRNPTPRGESFRNLAMSDTHPNVVYMARPCQYIMSDACDTVDWTDGRFSERVIDSMSFAIKEISSGRPVVLIGYSGGAMVSGLVIERTPDLNVAQWITIAGVLNHTDWTSYFKDTPLSASLSMNGLPQIKQSHYIIDGDKIVPNALSFKWIAPQPAHLITNASHSEFSNIELDF